MLGRERPWATVHRVELARGGRAWFKRCAPIQWFEPRLTAALASRWPDRVTEAIAHDAGRGWLLMRDAGASLRDLDNPPEAWLAILPRYAELQIGEAEHVVEHLEGGVPDARLERLPALFGELLRLDLPLTPAEIVRLRAFEPALARLCAELAAAGLPDTVQHDDLHDVSVYSLDGHLRVLDWGDASIAHPFFSLFVTFQFLGEQAQLRDAYLEPWGGSAQREAAAIALRLGAFARCHAWARQRESLRPAERPDFDTGFAEVLRRALRYVDV